MSLRSRLLLADDHTLVAEGLRKLLENEFDLLGVCESGQTLLEKAMEARPDAILLDISMPQMNGLETARRLRDELPSSKILFVTMHSTNDYVREAFRAGASGYVLKQSAASELVKAVRQVLSGNCYLTPLVSMRLEDIRAEIHAGPSAKRLTPRQREVLQLIGEGRSGKEIAFLMNISIKTVEFHKSALNRHLGLQTTAQLMKYALEQGLAG